MSFSRRVSTALFTPASEARSSWTLAIEYPTDVCCLPPKKAARSRTQSVGQLLAQIHGDIAWHGNFLGAALFAEYINGQEEHVSDGVLDRFNRALAVRFIHGPEAIAAMIPWTIQTDARLGCTGVQAGMVLSSCHPNTQDRVGSSPMGPAIDERADKLNALESGLLELF